MRKELSKAYNAREYEDNIYESWEKKGFFNPDNFEGEAFTIMMPPPNVTGVLHLGHALENTLMDTMARYQRMLGKKTLLLPGTDHSAVATQARVEKNLIEEGIENPRDQYGREGLLKIIKDYAENSKSTILNQIRKMGTSCDWSRLSYTFDEKRNVAVNKVFKKMYDDGLIYRGYRVVNWSTKGQSTCSDDELVYIDRKAKLYTFKYSADFPFTIATTRPETKFGDTAVAVNPDDERYAKYIGKEYIVKNFGGSVDLKLRIIADSNVDPKFGTGALGVTPAHSNVDFEMYENIKGTDNEINIIKVIDEKGLITSEAGKEYEGDTILEAREKVVKWLEDSSLMENVEEIDQSVGTSDRFGDVIESIPMTQWFVNVNKVIPEKNKSLKELMKEAVSIGHKGNIEKKVKITPARFEKVYYNWIDNLKDWCISRQIWWGHRIPVWYKKANKGVKITFLRHGESQANIDQISAGHMDSPLTDVGREACKGIKEKIIKYDDINVIYSSDLIRATESANIIFDDKKIIEDERLRQINFGNLQGKSGLDANKYRMGGFPGGENYQQLADRIIDFLSDMIDKHDGEHIGIVSHSGIWKVLEIILNDANYSYDHLCSYTSREPVEYNIDKLVCASENIPNGSGWIQDEDTLDTWFSSGLWTFSTLGWPEETKDMKNFYPTSWMQMGHEIIFVWLARMILMSTYVLDEVPFKDVYIHGMLRDKDGKKFSKSDKNGIDPIGVINEYGCDALRMSILMGISPGNDSRFYNEKVESSRNLVNKLWNISRYILMNVDSVSDKCEISSEMELKDKDIWILKKLDDTIKDVTNNLNKYNFSYASETLRDFTCNDLADWYLESAKAEGFSDVVLNNILNQLLKLWHPFMPFVTEAIWQEVYGNSKNVMIEKWPNVQNGYIFRKDEEVVNTIVSDFDLVREIISSIRSVRSENNIEPAKKIDVLIVCGKKLELIEKNRNAIQKLKTGIKELKIIENGDNPGGWYPVECGLGIEVFVDLSGTIDREKLKKDLEEAQKYATILDKKLENSEYVNNAPQNVVQKDKNNLEETNLKIEKLEKQLSNI